MGHIHVEKFLLHDVMRKVIVVVKFNREPLLKKPNCLKISGVWEKLCSLVRVLGCKIAGNCS
jgi:hypothetical protein